MPLCRRKWAVSKSYLGIFVQTQIPWKKQINPVKRQSGPKQDLRFWGVGEGVSIQLHWCSKLPFKVYSKIKHTHPHKTPVYNVHQMLYLRNASKIIHSGNLTLQMRAQCDLNGGKEARRSSLVGTDPKWEKHCSRQSGGVVSKCFDHLSKKVEH